MPTRKEVYEAIDSERDYQNSKFNEETTTSKGQHTVSEWILFMEDYLQEARNIASRGFSPQADQEALHVIRKVTGMGVACMEQNGASKRHKYWDKE